MTVVSVTIVYGVNVYVEDWRIEVHLEAQMQASLRPGKLRHFASRSLSKGHLVHVHSIESSIVDPVHWILHLAPSDPCLV
jgi:hypothetical protein